MSLQSFRFRACTCMRGTTTPTERGRESGEKTQKSVAEKAKAIYIHTATCMYMWKLWILGRGSGDICGKRNGNRRVFVELYARKISEKRKYIFFFVFPKFITSASYIWDVNTYILRNIYQYVNFFMNRFDLQIYI